MKPANVVNVVNEAWKISGYILEGFVIHQIDGLDLQRLHEALGLGIVVGVPTPIHRADETDARPAGRGTSLTHIASRDPSGECSPSVAAELGWQLSAQRQPAEQLLNG